MVKIVESSDRITLIIEGLPEDEGRVRFAAFMTQLQNLSATLAKLDREANDGKATTYFEIAELSYSSPIRIALEPRHIPKQRYSGAILVESLGRVTHALESGGDVTRLDSDLLDDLRGLAKPVGRTVKYAALQFSGQTFELSEQIVAKLDKALAVDEECDGSLDGMLEQINVHQGANTFHIYPAIGPRKVTCHFPSRLHDDAVAAVGKKVEVFGTLRYRLGSDFPHQIAVSRIDEFSPDFELPDWDDLRGRAPNATGDLSSEDFVREMRDAW